MIIALDKITDDLKAVVGGKAKALSKLIEKGITVPKGLCLASDTLKKFLAYNQLEAVIILELGRKELKDMRWEEMWDASLRIRNLIVRGNFPEPMRSELEEAVKLSFESRPVAIRSSANLEDSSKMSFAGVHESYVNIKGVQDILENIKLVWASLWSDAALLYQKDLGVNLSENGMAVIIQEFIQGEKSGVAFTQNPLNSSELVIECVPGINKGLVDGEVQPQRWIISRSDNRIVKYQGSETTKVKKQEHLLNTNELEYLLAKLKIIEDIFGCPQDVEWTFKGKNLFALQSRPITTSSNTKLSERSIFDLSLRRSLDNLFELKNTIELVHLKGISKDIEMFRSVDLSKLNDTDLALETQRRLESLSKWNKVYWDDFIPYGHGMRLFGQVYNNAVKPPDPYEFVELLRVSETISIKRDRVLRKMASIYKKNPRVFGSKNLVENKATRDFRELNSELMENYRCISQGLENPEILESLLKNISKKKKSHNQPNQNRISQLEKVFLSKFDEDEKEYAKKLIELGISSYVMRDDDNVYIEGIALHVKLAVDEISVRLKSDKLEKEIAIAFEKFLEQPAVKKFASTLKTNQQNISNDWEVSIKPKQLRGQPASKGIGYGKARIILSRESLKEFKPGEVLICDAIGPEMTYIVPVASAIVERRGGMLIHGAIIAREYAIPCVTGVSDIVKLIKTGDMLCVDGDMGLVTVESLVP